MCFGSPAKGFGLGGPQRRQRRVHKKLGTVLRILDGLAVAHQIDHAEIRDRSLKSPRRLLEQPMPQLALRDHDRRQQSSTPI